MKFISHIKKINIDMVCINTVKASLYTGSFTATTSGLHAAYIFSPDKSHGLPYNTINLMYNVISNIYLYGVGGFCNGLIWPLSIPCWTISTIKYVKSPTIAEKINKE